MLRRLAAAFPDRLYVELQRHGERAEADSEAALVDSPTNARPAAGGDQRHSLRKQGDHAAHDALMCIAASSYLGEEDRPRVSAEHYFKTRRADGGAVRRSAGGDRQHQRDRAPLRLPRAEKRKPILPRFDTKRGRDEPAELKAQAEAGLKARLKALGERCAAPEEEYKKRLDYEMGVITQMEFPGYFLIVSDFIKWAQGAVTFRSGRAAVRARARWRPGRSPSPISIRCAGGCLFERFLNPERVSMPDFDIDFCQERRGEVIEYVKNKYGEDRVAHIITFGTLQARAVLRDVGRVMQLPFGQVDKLAKLVPANPANPVTLARSDGNRAQAARRRARSPKCAR